MTKILAFSGKKQSGKNTAFNFLLGLEMIKSSLVRGNMTVTKEGRLWVSDLWGDESFQGYFDADRNTPTMIRLMNECVYPFLKPYSFAGILKQDVCMGVLGLSHEQCFGTDEQKNTLTQLQWENMPGVITMGKLKKEWGDMLCDWFPNDDEYGCQEMDESLARINLIYHAEGIMTAREVMQYVGTEIFRKMYGNVWADSTIKRIIADGSEVAVITDCRFPNEVKAVQSAGGKVVRLTRGPASYTDLHASETALDNYEGFDVILDNADMNVDEQNIEFQKILTNWGWLDKMETKRIKPQEA